MNDESMVAQGTVSNQAAAEALQTIAGQNHYAGGNALLSAEAEAGAQLDNSAIDQLVETKTASNQATENSTEAKRFTTTGNYPINFEHLSDAGDLSLTNDVPSAE
ncbi:hypothetical protein V2H45_08435 [Tumidithrix elongata RA019]|uniref:Uncharacterized protein n=1 Tax=Tumidithrix elongata BACA0141 TaxID=2716417 RepID=A0AAW9PVN2_9CYAN|nr:hypothetical protein [Tumidithrix elongata RA019]